MTPKEAIEELKADKKLYETEICHANDGTPDGYLLQALDMAIEALEKQIPKKPDYEADGYDNKGELIYDTWICPNCEKRYEVDYDHYDYCPKCGQAIDLSETK